MKEYQHAYVGSRAVIQQIPNMRFLLLWLQLLKRK